MALYVTSLQRATCSALRRACSRAPGGACSRAPGGACSRAPGGTCSSPPQPACRARHPAGRRGVRVVCCAPAPGWRPPCSPPPCAPSLTCQNVSHDQNCTPSSHHECDPGPECDTQPWVTSPSGWVCDQDPVAQRLERARCVRRAHYEREVACRASAPPAPSCCPAPYVLGGQRECARATDGCTYAVLHAPPATPACCGRTPPPPQCIELAPDDACRIRGPAHLDPCAHRPRVIIEIDRSASQDTCAAPAPARDVTPPAPHPAPQCCRRPTIVERLRAYVPGCQSERRTHTSVALSKAKKSSESVSGGLESMLRSKGELKEAGLGRVVTDVGKGPARPDKPSGGRLELSVPPGTARVAVHVSLSRAAGPPSSPSCSSSSPSCTSGVHSDSTSEKQNPCLSIMKIKKTWASQCDQKLARTHSAAGCAWSPVSPAAVSQCDPGVAQRDPGVVQCDPGVAQCDPGVAQCEPGVAQCDPGVAQCNPGLAQCDPGVGSRYEPGIATKTSTNEPKTKIKRCSSTSAFIANTIVVNS